MSTFSLFFERTYTIFTVTLRNKIVRALNQLMAVALRIFFQVAFLELLAPGTALLTSS